MGSEQSSQPMQQKPSQRNPQLTRGHTIAASHVPDAVRPLDPTPSGNDSPGASVCSDSELPYISYTVNRPIGDSPKMLGKSTGSQNARPSSEGKRSTISVLQRRQMSLQPRGKPQKKVHDIVVVKEAKSMPNIYMDEDVRRLQEIPTFLPIMRGTLGLPGTRDPEVLEGVEWRPWVRLAARYQAHLAACAQPVSADQLVLATRCKETDAEVARLLAAMVDRQRSNARTAEKLARVHELAAQLSRCHALLNRSLEAMDALNNRLPLHRRLEPFLWTTG